MYYCEPVSSDRRLLCIHVGSAREDARLQRGLIQKEADRAADRTRSEEDESDQTGRDAEVLQAKTRCINSFKLVSTNARIRVAQA